MSLMDDTDDEGDSSHDYVVTQVHGKQETDIEAIALGVLREYAPDFVGQPIHLDLSHLVDYELPRRGIHFVPTTKEELPGMWAFAQPTGEVGEDVEILIQEDEWESLHKGGRDAHHARGTVAHELGHVYLHVPQIRARLNLGLGLPRQVRASELKPWFNAEWQAWAFAGYFLAPRASILAANTLDITELARTFGMNNSLMSRHLERLKLGARPRRHAHDWG